MFFQWRAARAAAEKFHSAMLPHGGTEARGWSETVRLGSELAALEEIAGSTARADVAFVFGWDNWWAFDGADHPSQLLDLPAIVHSWYRPFFDGNIAVDIVPPAGDLAGYRLVVAPNLYLLTDEALEALTAFVRDGGVFVCGYFSGVVDENDHVRSPQQTAALRRLLGVRVDEFWPIPPGEKVSVELRPVWPRSRETGRSGSSSTAANRSRPIRQACSPAGLPRSDTPWATASPTTARPASTPPGSAAIVASACEDAPSARSRRMPAGVEACRRTSEGASYLFLLNHTEHEAEVELPPTAELVLGENPLPPLGVAIVGRRNPRYVGQTRVTVVNGQA